MSTITAAMEDYLKVIYGINERGDRVTTQAIAAQLDVAPPSVTGMLKRLSDLKLIVYEPYRTIDLTDSGRKVALEVVRHHRLLELYLAEALGYSWDEVHEEADRLEHLISEEFERRIDAVLGFPTIDPHGDPIPSATGDVSTVSDDRLGAMATGESGVVVRVQDSDAERLRYLGSLGLYPDAEVTMLERMPFNGPLRVLIGDVEHVVGRELADAVHVHTNQESEPKAGA
jgi:DtxR family Mn-dependent transcriptional regulator